MIPLILYPDSTAIDRSLKEVELFSNKGQKQEADSDKIFIPDKTIAIKHNSDSAHK